MSALRWLAHNQLRKITAGDHNDITSGTFANRPAAGTAKRVYWATDIAGGALFYDDGSAWKLVSPSAASSLGSVTTFNGTSQAAGTDVVLATLSTIPASSLAVNSTHQLLVTMDVDLINSATARNLVWKLKLGTTVILTWTLALKVSTAKTATGVLLTCQFACHTTGASGVIRGAGMVNSNGIPSAAADSVLTAQTAVAGVTLDTTAAQTITVTVNESVNSVAELVRSETASLQRVA